MLSTKSIMREGRRVVQRLAAKTLGERILLTSPPPYTAEYDREMPIGALNHHDWFSLAWKFVYSNQMEGDYFEFGSAMARTARSAATYRKHPYSRSTAEIRGSGGRPYPHLYIFDSFEGFPEPTEQDGKAGWIKGHFKTSLDDFRGLIEQVVGPADWTPIAGFYNESLTPQRATTLQQANVKASIVFLDCDFYSSTRDVLEWVPPFLQNGTLLAVDDYHNYRSDPAMGQQLAFTEWRSNHPEIELHPWRPFGIFGESFIVHIKGPDGLAR